MKRIIVLDADDFGPKVFAIPFLEELKSHIPNFKITLFTNSADPGVDLKTYKKWVDLIQKHYPWIEIVQHGVNHTPNEFNVTGKELRHVIRMMKRANRLTGLKPKKIMKAPFWQMSEEGYKYFKRKGYVVATDRNQIRPRIKGMKQYRWNWSFEEPDPGYPVLKGHGHVTKQSANYIGKCMKNLMDLPQDAEYLFVSEYIKRFGSD